MITYEYVIHKLGKLIIYAASYPRLALFDDCMQESEQHTDRHMQCVCIWFLTFQGQIHSANAEDGAHLFTPRLLSHGNHPVWGNRIPTYKHEVSSCLTMPPQNRRDLQCIEYL